jgi:hypothetical protein
LKRRNLILAFLLFIVIPLEQFAQTPHPILRNFSGQVTGNSIRLSWVIKGGNTCEGTKIQRSNDGLFFETIGEIGGVCGSPDFDVPYLFVDSLPIANQTNYYRLELGTQGFSTSVSFPFNPLNDQGYSIVLDRAQRTASVYFDNPQAETVAFQLITLNGVVLSKGNTGAGSLTFNFNGWPSGIYLIQIQFERQTISARLPMF